MTASNTSDSSARDMAQWTAQDGYTALRHQTQFYGLSPRQS